MKLKDNKNNQVSKDSRDKMKVYPPFSNSILIKPLPLALASKETTLSKLINSWQIPFERKIKVLLKIIKIFLKINIRLNFKRYKTI